MGIDARILLRVRMDKPTDEQITRWSWDLCRAVGAQRFWLSDGLPADVYKAASDAWHAAFGSHSEYARWKELSDATAWRGVLAGDADAITECREIGDRIRSAIGPAPSRLRRAMDLVEDYNDDDDAELQHGKVYHQDGDPICAADGEWLIEVHI